MTLEIGEIVVTDESPRDSSELQSELFPSRKSETRSRQFGLQKQSIPITQISHVVRESIPLPLLFLLWCALIENFVLDKMMMLKPIYHRAQREVDSPVENGEVGAERLALEIR